jgi:hypothetical protein
MAERFNETVNIRQVSSNVGGVEASLSLANRLDSFRQKRLQEAEQAAIQRGVESAGQTELKKTDINGQQVTQAPQKKEKSLIGSIEVAAHNKTLQAAYMASLDSDNRNAINQIYAENTDNLQAFNDAAEGYAAGVLGSVDPAARQAVTIDLQDRISSARNKVQIASVAKAQEAAMAEIKANADEAGREAARHARNGDSIEAGEELLRFNASIDALNLPVDQANKRKREARVEMEENFIKNDFDKVVGEKGLDAAFDKLADMEGNVPKGWEPDEWERVVRSQQADLNRLLTQQEKKAREMVKVAVQAEEFNAIEKRIAGDNSQIINPKTLDKYYQQQIEPIVRDMSIEQRQATQAQLIDQTKIIPTTIKRQLTNAANSDDPILLEEAAKLIDRIDDVRGLVDQVPANERAYITRVTDLMQNLDPQEAVEIARRATDPTDKDRIELVNDELKGIKNKRGFYIEKANDAFDVGVAGFFGFSPDIDEVSGAQMGKEYGAIYEAQRLAGSTDEQAEEIAKKKIQRTWGVSTVTGRENIIKYPPEDYYAVEGETDWIGDQLIKDVKKDTAGLDIKREDIFLTPNDRTAREASVGEPSYMVRVLIDGSFVPFGQWKPSREEEEKRLSSMNVTEALNRRKESLSKRMTKRGKR